MLSVIILLVLAKVASIITSTPDKKRNYHAMHKNSCNMNPQALYLRGLLLRSGRPWFFFCLLGIAVIIGTVRRSFLMAAMG